MTYYAFEALDSRILTRCVIAVNNSSKLPLLFRLGNWKLEREIDEYGQQPDWFNLSKVQPAIDKQGYWIMDYDHTTSKGERSALQDFLEEPSKQEESREHDTVTRKSSSKS